MVVSPSAASGCNSANSLHSGDAEDPQATPGLRGFKTPHFSRSKNSTPITQVSIIEGKSETYRRAVADTVCDALHQAFGVPEDDRFVTILVHPAADFFYAPLSMGIARTADALIFRVTANRGRSTDQKKAFYLRLACLLQERLNVRPEDVFISLVEVEKENWPFGPGIAQLA